MVMNIKYTHQIVSIISDLRRGGGTLSHTSLLLNKLCNTHKTINTARSRLKNDNNYYVHHSIHVHFMQTSSGLVHCHSDDLQ